MIIPPNLPGEAAAAGGLSSVFRSALDATIAANSPTIAKKSSTYFQTVIVGL
jgi:hypothetical protein